MAFTAALCGLADTGQPTASHTSVEGDVTPFIGKSVSSYNHSAASRLLDPGGAVTLSCSCQNCWWEPSFPGHESDLRWLEAQYNLDFDQWPEPALHYRLRP